MSFDRGTPVALSPCAWAYQLGDRRSFFFTKLKGLYHTARRSIHPEGNSGANLESISHRCHPILVACVWELTKQTIDLPLGCLQGG